jgi:hypothetical protein
MASKERWIASAIKHKGSFTAAAKRAVQTVSGYATKVLKAGSTASTKTKRRANLAQTLGAMSAARKRAT